jgi:ubiquinone biosynthesis protein
MRCFRIQWVLKKNNIPFSRRQWEKKEYPQGKPLRLALETLGPLFVKFGQLLSTRKDLLPEDMAVELAKLQDQVPPFCSKIARNLIEKSLGAPIENIFAHFDEIPLASASVAQVHSATLKDGTAVIIKVLRPDIHHQVQTDIALLERFAYWGERCIPRLRPLRPTAVVQEFKQILSDELDLSKEAANASLLRRNFQYSESLYVPKIYWEYCRKNVLVMERIYGIPISDIALLKEKKVDIKRLAERGVEIFFTQVFRDCFFHADMHPGNIFVSFHHPHNPQYIAVDFGIMGTLSPDDQRYLAENFLAFFKRDYRRVAELHVKSGWVPSHTRIEAFESAIRTVCEPIFEQPLKDISIGQTLMHLFQTARQFDMQVQPQLVLLQKTLFSIEGLGRTLYPDLDLWSTAKPFLEQWMKKQFGPRAFFRTMRAKLPLLTDKMPDLPETLIETLSLWRKNTHILHQELAKNQKKKKYFLRTIGIAFLLLGSCFALTSDYAYQLYEMLREYQWVMVLLCLGSGIGLFVIASR